MSTVPAPVLVLLSAPTENEPLDGTGFAPADPTVPHLDVNDLGAVRGDGIFETIGVMDGRPQALDAHLLRFARSAAQLDLPAPRLDVWRAAVLAAIETARTAGTLGPEVGVKTVLTRGVEGTGVATGWVRLAPAPDLDASRRDGVRVLTLDRGFPADVAQRAPWLLQGAKTLSYAVNMAALRYAHGHDADDVIFVSADGAVLEGPTANVLARIGDEVVTPPTDQAILPGTTQARAFDFFAGRGLRTVERRLEAAELAGADGLWLTSSVRLVVPVRILDGVACAVDVELTRGLLAHLRAVTD
ncbi:aminodeoxychorismate lyase [Occultella glacieicola]|uniref:aminodeoxychorismate lyase n=1 Tax=Occultella glacieicola TaxID=2518684 RepID=UPI0014047B46|nr:aminodeoxychorismate lyase [Occultella glacieicola]